MALLRGSQQVILTSPRNLDSTPEPRRFRGAQGVGIVANFGADLTGTGTAIAQVHRQRIMGMARQNPYRSPHFVTGVLQFYDFLRTQAELFGRFRADQYGVVPGDF